MSGFTRLARGLAVDALFAVLQVVLTRATNEADDALDRLKERLARKQDS